MDEAKLRETQEAMANLCKDVQKHLPPGWGWFVFVTPFGGDTRANYASNMERKGALATMKEFLLKNGEAEDWMKHIE